MMSGFSPNFCSVGNPVSRNSHAVPGFRDLDFRRLGCKVFKFLGFEKELHRQKLLFRHWHADQSGQCMQRKDLRKNGAMAHSARARPIAIWTSELPYDGVALASAQLDFVRCATYGLELSAALNE